MTEININTEIKLNQAIFRGLKHKCPKCGKGKLFKSYLKLSDKCDNCGQDLSHIKADDGPAWLTILLTGHIIVPMLIETQIHGIFTPIQGAFFWCFMAAILMLGLLPLTKGLFVGLLWHIESKGR